MFVAEEVHNQLAGTAVRATLVAESAEVPPNQPRSSVTVLAREMKPAFKGRRHGDHGRSAKKTSAFFARELK